MTSYQVIIVSYWHPLKYNKMATPPSGFLRFVLCASCGEPRLGEGEGNIHNFRQSQHFLTKVSHLVPRLFL